MTRVLSPRQARHPAARAALASPLPVPCRPIKWVEGLEQRVLLAVFTVTTIADAGPGSLRQAIVDVNAAAGADEIHFNIPGDAVHSIAPLSALPVVSGAVTIDGTTQPGYAGAPRVELNGSLARPLGTGTALINGLEIAAGGPSVVRGLAINRFAYNGIALDSGAVRSRVEACYMGTNAAGTEAAGNGGAGIRVATGGVVIGGAAPSGATSSPGTTRESCSRPPRVRPASSRATSSGLTSQG